MYWKRYYFDHVFEKELPHQPIPPVERAHALLIAPAERSKAIKMMKPTMVVTGPGGSRDKVGVHQGMVFSPLLFILCVDVITKNIQRPHLWGILNADGVKALNYGGIGAVIGHEITHGFDDQGSQFDSIGNLLEWWDTNTKKKFQERAQCIINQYGKTEVAGTALRINGKLTQGENIADNGGIKQAFRAYKNYLKRHGEERRIKGLEQFNNEQMFFLGYAAVCPVKLLSPSITCDYRP
ncbi:hypothetical protein Y032_0017g3173 [Ancylostoma ceylanicum]|nr:hypothetical protein Y032_0017g3173 [Ancylostoma ceylanicum]